MELIDQIRDWTGSPFIGDDCAVLGAGTLASVDTLVDEVHFISEQIDFRDLGWKAVAVNLSDIAAMGGRPRYVLVSLSVPDSFCRSKIKNIYDGIMECTSAFRVRVAGGDLTGGSVLSISVTVLGDAHEDGLLLRSGAKPSDLVVVTGDFGASACGFFSLDKPELKTPYCKNRHFRPKPRLCESWALMRATRGRGALMDASDGLADALFQIALASDCDISLDAEKVPVHQECLETARQVGLDHLDWALYGGEDYELVACLDRSSFEALSKEHGQTPFNSFHVIGEVRQKAAEQVSVTIHLDNERTGTIDMGKSFQHFKSD